MIELTDKSIFVRELKPLLIEKGLLWVAEIRVRKINLD